MIATISPKAFLRVLGLHRGSKTAFIRGPGLELGCGLSLATFSDRVAVNTIL